MDSTLSVISGLYTDVFLVEGKWFAYSTLMFTLGESTVFLKSWIDFIYAEKETVDFPFSYRSKVAYPFFHRKNHLDL
jgi:hypothetical protein